MRAISFLIRYGTILLAVLGVASMALVLQELRAKETGIPPPPVQPPAKPYADGVAATGILEALDENVSIGAPVAGLVLEIPQRIEVNAAVEEGEVLFRLDGRELKAQRPRQEAAVEVARTNIEVARAQLTKAEDLLKTLKSVPDERAISQDDIRQRINDVAVAKAQVAATQAQFEAAQAEIQQTDLLIERLTIRAPKPGTILQKNIRAGEYVSPTNSTPPLVLGDLSSFQVRTDVDEQNATKIRKGQGATAYLKGDSETPYAMEFLRIEPYVIPKVSLTGASTERVDTRVLQVIFKLRPPAETPLYVGQQVDVFIGEKKQTSSPPVAKAVGSK